MKTKVIISAVCTAIPLSGVLAQKPPKDLKPMNVLLIMADDMGAMELGCYGSNTNLTPNFDKLAKSGFQFSTFFATPVSTPTRVSLMTGKYGVNTSHTNMSNLPGGKGRGYDLAKEEYTFGQMFKDAGYATAMAGKWQLSGKGETLITECGFDEYMSWIYLGNLPKGESYKGGFYPPGTGTNTSRYWHPGIMVNGKHIETKPTDYGPDMYSGFIMDFIKRNAAIKKPFFAYYPMTLVHTPWVATPDNPNVKDNTMEALKANVEYTDKIIGRLIKTLEDAGVRENTLVIFLGDNGTENWGKQTVTEWGPRTPFLVSCPGIVKSNIISDVPVDLPDVMSTMLDFTNVKVKSQKDLDGKSLMPVLTGKTREHKPVAKCYYGNYRVYREKEWLLESNNDENFGELYYCGNKKNGLGYELITDFSKPEAAAAKKRFEGYIEQSGSRGLSQEEKNFMLDFVTKKRQTMIKNLKSKYTNVYLK